MRSTCLTGVAMGIAIALAASSSAVGGAATLHVPGDYPTIKDAINAARAGDEVVIADGTYLGAGNKNLTLDKAITVRSANGAAHCIIDAELAGKVFTVAINVGPDTIIQGLTIRRASVEGGGMRIQGSPTVRDCVVTDCFGFPGIGAAVYVHGSSAAPLIERCVFADNVDLLGAGITLDSGAHPTINECVFSGNVAFMLGGAIYIHGSASASITGCTFVGNLSGAIYNQSFAQSTIVNCLFSGNDGFGGAGGIHGGTAPIVNCTFADNVGPAVNGNATIVNSILVGSVSSAGVPLANQVSNPNNFTISFSNVENGWSGAGSNNINADPLFATLASGTWNAAPFYDAEANLTVYTDTTAAFIPGALVGLVFNPDSTQQRRQYIAANSATTMSVHGDFISRPIFGPDNMFVEVNDGYAIFDARPSAGSPVIDAGMNAAVPRLVLVDLDGNPRFVDDPNVPDTGFGRAPLVDMGAFERQVPLAADLNGDGAVDASDLGILLGAWGSSDAAADLDGDSIVGAGDLGLLLGAWTG